MIDLADKRFAGLPAEQKLWLQSQLGTEFGIEAFRDLTERSDLSPLQRSIVVGMKQTLSGEMRALAGRALTKDGAKTLSEIRARTLAVSRAPVGETELQQKVRKEMPAALSGHETQLDGFVELARRSESPAWSFAPLFAIVGRQGHGKDEALEKYAKTVLGEEALVEFVELGRFNAGGFGGGSMGASAASAFGKNGPLSIETLKTYEPGYQPPEPEQGKEPIEAHPRIVVLRGVKDLRKNNPDAAQMLADILGARKGSPNYVNVQFVFDFEEPVGAAPKQLMIDAVAEIGARNLCAHAEFKDLSGDTLAQYAEPILLESLKLQGTGNTVLEVDEDADTVLRRALATPFAPLDELDARLYEWLISKFDTQTSVDRETDVLRVSLNPKYAGDSVALDNLVAQLHQQYADPKIGADLFVVNIVGKQVEADPGIQIALDRGRELTKTLQIVPMQLTLGMPLVEPEAIDQLAAMLGALRQLGDSMQSVLTVARKQNELQREDVLPTVEAEALYAAIEHAEQHFFALDDQTLQNVPPDWLLTVKGAAEQWLVASRLIADTLWGEDEAHEEAPQA